MIFQIFITMLVGWFTLFLFLKSSDAIRQAINDYKTIRYNDHIRRSFMQGGIFFAGLFFILGIGGLFIIAWVWECFK